MKKIILILLLLTVWQPMFAQKYFLKGKIIDQDTKLPLPDVVIVNGADSVLSDDQGGFSILLPAQDSLFFYRKGYQNLSVATTGDLSIFTVAMSRSVVSLSTIKVRAFGLDGTVFRNPASVSVLGGAEIQRQAGNNIANVLNQVAGVQMQERTPG